MNVNNYECPKCHNVFPESNKFLHDQRCTASNPVPLNQSRIAFINEQNKNKKKEPVRHISGPNYQANRDLHNNNIRKKEEEKFFTCWLCGNTLKESEKTDHMLCHQMQEENEAFKNKNKKEEKNKINNNNNNNNRPRRDMPNRFQNNQRNNQRNDNKNNTNKNLKRSQLKFSDWQIFDFGGLRESLNKMDNPTDEDILEQLPESEIEDVSQLSEEKKECIICLINFKKSDKITILPCTHMFHSF